MKTMGYDDLLAQIAPLDLSTLTRLEMDLTRMVQQRRAKQPGPRRSIMELAAQARQTLENLPQDEYWAGRERERQESRSSWSELS